MLQRWCALLRLDAIGDREGKQRYIKSDVVKGDIDVGRQILLE